MALQLTLQLMKIAVCTPFFLQDHLTDKENFIVETLCSLASQNSSDDVFIIVENHKGLKSQVKLSSNINIITARSLLTKGLFRKIWWDVQLPGILRKIKADVFISFENKCSLITSTPQIIAFPDVEKIRSTYLKKASLILVPNKKAEIFLKEKFGPGFLQIGHLYPSAAKKYKFANGIEKEKAKHTFSDGKEYFLYNSSFSRKEDILHLLKGFSFFKKRQQSNFKLLMFVKPNSSLVKDLATYKYRADISFIDVNDKTRLAEITAAAYAVVLPFSVNDPIAALNALRSGVPVVASKESSVFELAADAVLFTETQTTKELGEKMMQLYTNENYRSILIEKGKLVTARFTQEGSAQQLWQSIVKLVP
jgi:glycosyltransferase involved in cell wall biosynthesis